MEEGPYYRKAVSAVVGKRQASHEKRWAENLSSEYFFGELQGSSAPKNSLADLYTCQNYIADGGGVVVWWDGGVVV